MPVFVVDDVYGAIPWWKAGTTGELLLLLLVVLDVGAGGVGGCRVL